MTGSAKAYLFNARKSFFGNKVGTVLESRLFFFQQKSSDMEALHHRYIYTATNSLNLMAQMSRLLVISTRH